MSDETENELILGAEDTVTEQLAKKIYTNIYLKAKKNDFQI